MAYQPGSPDNWTGWDDPTAPLTPRPGAGRGTYGAPVPPLPTYGGAMRSPTLPRTPAPPLAPPPLPVPHAPRRRRPLAYGLLVALVLVVLLGGIATRRAYAFGNAISTQAPFSTQTGYLSGAGRVNLFVLGYGGGNHDGANLTDSMMVLSIVPSSGATTLISVPRDLWVQVPPGSGQYAKINTAYQDGISNGFDGQGAGEAAGGAEAARKVSDVLGISVSYWLTIDFQGFRKLVDTLGGVDITVPVAFTARYPANDDPQIDASWKTIHFATGKQHMDGERAIEYARARYVESPASEGTDFARSARQQLLIRAILGRARQVSEWPSLSGAADALQQAMRTNLSLADLALYAQKMDLTHATRIGLSNQNVLTDAVSSDQQAILLPKNGDWDAIRRYIAAHLAS